MPISDFGDDQVQTVFNQFVPILEGAGMSKFNIC